MHVDGSVEASPTATSWLLNMFQHSRIGVETSCNDINVVQMTVFAPGRKQRQDPMIKNGQETAEDSGHAQQQNPWLRTIQKTVAFCEISQQIIPCDSGGAEDSEWSMTRSHDSKDAAGCEWSREIQVNVLCVRWRIIRMTPQAEVR